MRTNPPQPEVRSPKFSYFRPPIRNVFPSEELDLAELCERIRGNNLAGITERLRALPSVKERQALKAQSFPYVTFAGIFRKRNDRELLEPSGLMVFDFDHLEQPSQVKQLLLNDRYFDTELLFTSPSGKGLKWVVQHSQEMTPHREDFFLGVSNYLKASYGLEADRSGRDLSRACYICQDSEVYLNPSLTPGAVSRLLDP